MAHRKSDIPAWQRFASALLQRHAIVRRMSGLPPRDFAGLVIDDAEVDRVVRQLPGLDGPEPGEAAAYGEKLDAQVERLRKEMRREARRDRSEPLHRIAKTARLSNEETELFAFLAAIELSPQRQRLLAYLQDNVAATRPWLATIDELFATAGGARLAARDAALSVAELIAVDESGPWGARAAQLPERVTWALLGEDSLDGGLPARAMVIESDSGEAPRHTMIAVTGADRESRLRTALARTDADRFLVTPEPAGRDEWRSVIREATVSGLGVVIECEGELSADAAGWMDRAAHVAFAVSSHAEQPLERMPDREWKEFRVADGAADADDWKRAVNESPRPELRLNREQLRLAARALRSGGGGIESAVRRLASGHLDQLAVQVRPSRDWDDIILPPRQSGQLRELAARFRRRSTVFGEWGFSPQPSTGVVALFAGASGTGKTLAAEVIAADLRLDLYKIDLSTVVSKYIGETEKNLERIFDAASAGDMVLFFDEADALFGKRSDVSDAHDRYANIEVAYLLQRLEMYDGLVIMATNLQGNIDQAFLRRIHVAVDFPMPSEKERERIWKLSFPDSAPVADIDTKFLAGQFRISGGNIRNAALSAAFFAADGGSKITMREVVRGLERELEKLGRMITPEEFGKYAPLLKDGKGA